MIRLIRLALCCPLLCNQMPLAFRMKRNREVLRQGVPISEYQHPALKKNQKLFPKRTSSTAVPRGPGFVYVTRSWSRRDPELWLAAAMVNIPLAPVSCSEHPVDKQSKWDLWSLSWMHYYFRGDCHLLHWTEGKTCTYMHKVIAHTHTTCTHKQTHLLYMYFAVAFIDLFCSYDRIPWNILHLVKLMSSLYLL